MSTPTYIYKIVPASAVLPSPLPDALPVSELDSSDGFIHLSTAVQVPGTLKRFFSDEESVYILRIIYTNVEKDIKWENDKGKGKPKCHRTKAKTYLDLFEFQEALAKRICFPISIMGYGWVMQRLKV